MNRFYFIFIFAFVITGIAGSCLIKSPETEQKIREKSKTYLKEKYAEDFEIKEFKQFFHGGFWRYETDLFAYPEEDTNLVFYIKYDAENKCVARDEYKNKFWERQIENEYSELLHRQFPIHLVRAKLKSNKSLIFNSTAIFFEKDFYEIIDQINAPALSTEIHLVKNIKHEVKDIESIIMLSDSMYKKGFVKTEYEIYFYDEALLEDHPDIKNMTDELTDKSYEPYRLKELLFKSQHDLPKPTSKDILHLLNNYDEDSLYINNSIRFEQAEKASNSGDYETALKMFYEIIDHTSMYRFRKYIKLESAMSIDAAIQAAEIYEMQNKKQDAKDMYRYIIKRLEYEEVSLGYAPIYRKAKQKLSDPD